MTARIATLLFAAGLGGTVAASGAAPAAPSQPPVAGDAAASYQDFQDLYAAGRHREAIAVGQSIVHMLEEADPRAPLLADLCNELGAVQLAAGDPAAAVPSFLRAIDLLEATEGISSRRLLAPLQGLGYAYAALDRPDLAILRLRHAVAISRRADGLMNLGQLVLLEALIDNYRAIDDVASIDQERRYAVQVVQQAYGNDDPRTLPMVMALADWYSQTDRHAPACDLYRRVVQIASVEDEGRNAVMIAGLVGIARSHRLQYVDGPDGSELASAGPAVASGPMPAHAVSPQEMHARIRPARMNGEGIASLERALSLLESASDPPSGLLAAVLLELGDWHLTARDAPSAMEAYERAWPLLEQLATDATPNPLRAPRAVSYRPPIDGRRSRIHPPPQAVERVGEFSLAVQADGSVSDVARVGGDLSLGRGWQVQRALTQSQFSPRFEDGRPVATEGVAFAETWFESLAEGGPVRAGDAPGGASQAEAGAPTDPAGAH